MPRDKRLYMTFPIDMDEHPKIELLSDSAFRTFFKMNGYSRRQKLDGRIPADNAARRWKPKDLRELLASHDERPLVYLEDGFYVIRSYADHQFTTADETELHERKARAGAAGGRAKAAAVAGAKQPPKQDLAGSESGIEIDKTDDSDSTETVTKVDARDEDQSGKEFAVEEAAGLGIKNLQRVRTAIKGVLGEWISWAETVDVARALIDLSTDHVKWAEAYIERVCTNSPDEVRAAWSRVPRPGKQVA